MATGYIEENLSPFIAMSRRQFIQIAVTGFVIGLVVWGVSALLDTYVYQAILCHGSGMKCDSSMQYAQVTAMMIGAIVALFGLVRLQIFRPLLVVLAATIGLWGVGSLVLSMPWFGALLAMAAVFALAYLLFSWLVRIRSFILACVAVIVMIIILRLVLNA